MANDVVIELARRSRRPVLTVEKMWRKAKRLAAQQHQKGNYLLVAQITKRMLRLSDNLKTVHIGQRVQWTVDGVARHGTVEATLPEVCFILVGGLLADDPLVLALHHGIMRVPLLDVLIV